MFIWLCSYKHLVQGKFNWLCSYKYLA